MIVTKTWISQNYAKFNSLYWDGKLPSISFKVTRSRKTWGFAGFRYDLLHNTIIPTHIAMSNYYDSPEEVKIQTLLHEMIHIADYTFHPEHFVRNGRRVNARNYDAHGYYFLGEAKRLKKYGWNISGKVTAEERNASTLSAKSNACLKHKIDTALVCVLYGNVMNFMFKTDVYKAPKLARSIRGYSLYGIGKLKKFTFYSFNDEHLANMRSCAKDLRGWYYDDNVIADKLKKIKAKEVKI